MRSFQEIDQERRLHGFTAKAVYQAAEIHHRTWQRLKQKQNEPNLSTLRKLSKALDHLVAQQKKRAASLQPDEAHHDGA